MKTQTVQQSAVSRFQQFAKRIAEKLPTKTTAYFLSLITGALLAIARRRTVTQWLKAAQMSDKFRQAFHHLPNIGRKSEKLLDEALNLIWEKLGIILRNGTKLTFWAGVELVLRAISDARKYHVSGGTQYRTRAF